VLERGDQLPLTRVRESGGIVPIRGNNYIVVPVCGQGSYSISSYVGRAACPDKRNKRDDGGSFGKYGSRKGRPTVWAEEKICHQEGDGRDKLPQGGHGDEKQFGSGIHKKMSTAGGIGPDSLAGQQA